MPQVLQFWFAMDMRRRVIVVVASLAMFATIIVMSRIAAAPSMALLYSGLDPAAAGQVVAELEARGVTYEVRGTAIHVNEQDRDSLRLALAAEGLPTQGGSGYELLDSLTGFGTTAQMFDAAWIRAVEGELTRTILSNPQFRAARVHIARGANRPFARESTASASVLVTAVGGVSQDQARALRHLVAAAVTGLRPDRVEIIDSGAGLIAADGFGAGSGAAERAEMIRRNLERLLAARVGQGGAVVEVSVDIVTESEVLTERRLDPQGRVAVATESQSSSGTESGTDGAVTVASNLPDGEVAPGGQQQSQSQETRETASFDVSETRREVQRNPGDIRRIGVAVLVDGVRTVAEDGTETWQPRPEEELSALRELIASAAGIDDARGDSLTIKSMELQPIPEGDAVETSGLSLDMTRLAGLGLLAAALFALAFFVLRPALKAARAAEPALALPPASPLSGPVLTGEVADSFDMPTFARSLPEMPEEGMAEDPVERLRRLIAERQAESIEILREWMDADRGRNR